MNAKCPDTLDMFASEIEDFRSNHLIANPNSIFNKVSTDAYIDVSNPDFDCEGCTAYPLASPDNLNAVTGYLIRGTARKYDTSLEPHKVLEEKEVAFNIGSGALATNTNKKYLSYAIGTNDINLFVKIAEAGESVVYHKCLDTAYQLINGGMPETIFRLMAGYKKPKQNDDLFVQLDENFKSLPKAEIKKLFLEKVNQLKNEISPETFIQPPVVDKPSSQLQIVNMSDIQAQPITWLWDGWLPLGKMTILAGAGGCGKTNLTLALIATITTGGIFPDGSKCSNVGKVLIYSTEDDPADTLKPRLIANGADISKVSIISGRTNEKGELEPFDPAQDFPKIEEYIKANPDVKLLMIDPIISAVSGDMNKANDVRRSLQPLVDLANEYKFSVLGITHFAKGTSGSSPADRIIGSQAFTALARMAWSAAKREDEGDCILVRAKSNNSILEGGVRYQIEPETVLENIETTKTVWLGTIEGTAKELLNEAEATESSSSAFDEAKDFLIDLLSPVESMASKEVKQHAKDAAISWRTIERASSELKIKKSRPHGETSWHWKLPDIFKDVPQVLPEHKQHY